MAKVLISVVERMGEGGGPSFFRERWCESSDRTENVGIVGGLMMGVSVPEWKETETDSYYTTNEERERLLRYYDELRTQSWR